MPIWDKVFRFKLPFRTKTIDPQFAPTITGIMLPSRVRPELVLPDEYYETPTCESSGYAPMDCPNCGRHRLEYYIKNGVLEQLKCEKCGVEDWEHPMHSATE